jgi:putative ABC transport system permease protein
MLINHFKIAWRNLLRHKLMSIINIAGLGIGMAASVLIVLWVQNELSFDRFQPDADHIYRITSNISVSKTEQWHWESSQYLLGDFAVKQIPEIENVTRLKPLSYEDVNFQYNGKIISESKSAYVDAQWFKMFHYDFVEGSPADFEKNPFSLILTTSAAKRYFGNEDAVGKVLKIDTVNYQVQAIVKDNPANSSFQYNVLIPVAAELTNINTKKSNLQWGNYNYLTFVKLKAGANTAAVSTKLIQILHHSRKDDNGKTVYSLVELKDIHFENDIMQSALSHGNRLIVDVFMILAGLLLITACINYVNLTTARASIRSKEVGIRKIIGANRKQLFGQFMSESFLVSLLALLLAVLLIQISMPWFESFTGRQFDQPLYSPVVWIILFSTLLVAFLLNGIYPAMLLSSFHPIKVFRGKSLLNFKDSALRRLLVITQFTISVILIVATVVIYNQLQYAQKIDPGYNRSHVFSFSFPWWKLKGIDFNKSDAVLNTVKQELKAQSAIAGVSMASSELVNFTNQSSASFDWNGRPKDFNPALAPLQADPDFQKLMGLKVKEGRWFNTEKADQHNVLLNETAVQLLHIPAPLIGQRFIHNGDTGIIVGVVKDFHYRSLHDKIGPMIIGQLSPNGFYVKSAAGSTAAAINAAKKVWSEFFPSTPFKYDFLDESYSNLYKAEQQSSILIALFAGIAIMVSALGLLGLAAFAGEQRVKEIGIRKVLGASIQHIISMLSADFLKMVLIACLIAFPVAWWAMTKWLQGFAYRINFSWWIFALAAGLALLIALITVSFQAIKAAIANPADSLRSE